MTNQPTTTGREVERAAPTLPNAHASHEITNANAHTTHYAAPSVGDRLPSPAQFDMMMRIAGTVTKAGSGANSMVPQNITTPEAALAVMLAGAELDFPPFAALRQIFIVNGKTELMTEGKLALMRQRDPSLRIEWHRGARRGLLEDGTRGAEATLWRGGEAVVRMRYDLTDKERAHQGQKRSGGPSERKWIPDLDANGKQKINPPGSRNAGEPKVKINPAYDESAPVTYEDDPESPWTKYEPDMFDWAVLKRLERYGASDLVNLTPLTVVEALPGGWTVEEDQAMPEEPRTPLSQAIIRGEIEPARVVAETQIPEGDGDPDEPPADDDDEDPDAAAEAEDEAPPADVQDLAYDDIDVSDLPAAEVRDLAEPTAEELETLTNAARQKLYDEAMRIQKAGTLSPTEYGALIRRLGAKFSPDANKLSTTTLSLEAARECLAELLAGAGEAPPTEPTEAQP